MTRSQELANMIRLNEQAKQLITIDVHNRHADIERKAIKKEKRALIRLKKNK